MHLSAFTFCDNRDVSIVAFYFVNMDTISQQFWDFLGSVDLPKQREVDFLRQVAGTLLLNSTVDEYDLIGFEVSDAKRGSVPDAGVAAFIRRAVTKANERYAHCRVCMHMYGYTACW